MKETDVRTDSAKGDERLEPKAHPNATQIRLLDEFELSLAGGGYNTDGWP